MATLTHDTSEVMAARRARAGLAFAVLAAASFGLSGSLASGLLDAGWSPAALVLCRLALGAVALSAPALVALRGRWHLLRANAGFLLSFGLVAGAGAQFAYFNAVDRMPVAIAILIEYVAPVAVVVWLWMRHQQTPSLVTVGGAAVAIAGLLLVLDVFSVGSVDGIGVLWALGGMVGCACFFVLSSGEDNGVPPVVLAAGGLVVGSVGLGMAGLLGLVSMSASTGDATYDDVTLPWWLPVLALGVVTAAVSYLSGIVASRLLGARLA
jgi:drug/metabolite transporter (DMT)-like permease